MLRIIYFTLCLAFVLSNCSPKRPDVIERPVFDVWNSRTLEIDKIVMTDSSTIFHIDAFYQPNQWIRIDSDTYIRETGTDEKLVITRAEGITINEHFYMPESGETSFQLHFPPLPANVNKIDFIESDCDGCFKIWGISLLPDSKVSMGKAKNTFTENSLPAPTFSNEAAKLKGKMKGYEKYMDFSKVEVYHTNVFTSESEPVEIPIQEDGSFTGEINVGLPSLVASRNLGYVFLTPGQEIEVNIDLRRKSRFESRYRRDKEPEDSLYISLSDYGSLAYYRDAEMAINGSLHDYDAFFKDLADVGSQEYRQYFIDKAEANLNALKEKNYPENLQMLLEEKINVWLSGLLLNYKGFATEAYFRSREIARENREGHSFEPETPDAEYYSYLNNWLNERAAYHHEFSYLLSSIRQNDLFNIPKKGSTAKEQFEYFREKISPYLGAEKSSIYDIAQGQFYMANIGQPNFLTDAEKQEIKNDFSNSAIAENLIVENDNLLAIVEANKKASEKGIVLNEAPDVPTEQAFDAILSKHKGNVVFVDFWATWCGPCIHAMKQMKPHKEKMLEKGVVFVYLTDESSPIGLWNKMIADTEGEHYRVDKAQWDTWYKQHEIQGIPTMMIYDREGTQISRYTGFPGIETIQENIDKAS
ncbi:MAG: TlpA family protein disulfide reductase [Cyclobacteriaceae bacterium]